MNANISEEIRQEILSTAYIAGPQENGKLSAFYSRFTLNAGLMDMVDQYIIRAALGLPCEELASSLIDVVRIGMEEYAAYPEYLKLLQESVDLMSAQMPISLFQRYDLDDLFRRVQTNQVFAEKIVKHFKKINPLIDANYLHKSFWKYLMPPEYRKSFSNQLYWKVIDCSYSVK